MASLADEIAKLCDLRPKIIDPEDDIHIETVALVCERFDEDPVAHCEVNNLCQGTDLLLADTDSRYARKRISRKSVDQSYNADIESSSSGKEGDEDYSEDDSDLRIFQKNSRENTDDEEEEEDSINEESNSDRSSDAEPYSNESEEEIHDSEVRENCSADVDSEDEEEEEDQETEGMFQKFSHIDVNEEVDKGRAVEAQLGLWNKLCESRIRFQKLLAATNRLPQFDIWDDFKKKSDSSYSDALEKGCVALKSLLDSMLELQSQLLYNNSETRKFVVSADNLSAPPNDEEISSGSESVSEGTVVKSKMYPIDGGIRKRKLKIDEYGDILAKRFKSFVPYRNSVIDKWDEKTRLSAGSVTQKSFNAFNQPAIKQIEQILQDKQRLIRRTQLKRSTYNILGKTEENETSPCLPEQQNEVEDCSRRDEHLSSYDPEIFDDDDFYHFLLKDIIESKSAGMDPDLIRMQKEIQKNRRKIKKKVDTKASKGRKLRYDAYPQLVNYFTPLGPPQGHEESTNKSRKLFSQNTAIYIEQ